VESIRMHCTARESLRRASGEGRSPNSSHPKAGFGSTVRVRLMAVDWHRSEFYAHMACSALTPEKVHTLLEDVEHAASRCSRMVAMNDASLNAPRSVPDAASDDAVRELTPGSHTSVRNAAGRLR
jgi:hypothetical protein